MDENMTDVNIQQLNLSYDKLEDRLLLKLGLADDTEVAVWLTRNLVKVLWPMLQSSSLMPLMAPDTFTVETQPILEEFARVAEPSAPKKMNFSESYKADRVPRTPQPVLPSDCRLLSLDEGKKYRLELEARDVYTVRIPLSTEITQALTNMLQLATKEAAWDISLVPGQLVMSESGSRPVLH
jgi:hypothetical protein